MVIFAFYNTYMLMAVVALLFIALIYAVKCKCARKSTLAIDNAEYTIVIDAVSKAPFAIYTQVEQLLADAYVSEQVADGCVGLLKQYIERGGVTHVQITRQSKRLFITILPQGIVINVN